MDHVFVGALAVAAFGVPRTTTDVDVIAEYGPEDTRRLADAFRRQGFQVPLADLRDALTEGSHATVHDTRSLFHIDLVPAVRPPAKDAIQRRARVRWRGVILPIADPEHTIVMKLTYGSERDVEDALGIYVRQRKRLDVRGMQEFARRQGILKALRYLERKVISGANR